MQNKKRPESSHKHWTLLLGIGLGGCFVQTVCAGELAYGVGYVGEYSDNIGRTSSNPKQEWINSAIVGIAYRENGPALAAHVLAQAEYRDYKHNIYRDESLYDVDASLLWWISPQRLNWVLIDRYEQITRDITSPDTPDNRINSNVLSTGPEFLVRFGQVNTLVLGLRYGNASYSDAALNNHRYGASARWRYTVNTRMTYSLNYEAEQVRYEDDIRYSNLTRHDVFARMDMRQARTNFQLDLGTTRIEREQTGETDGYLGRLTWSQQLTSASSVGILLAGEYLDAGTVLLSTATGSTPTSGSPSTSPVPSEATNDYFYTKRTELYYTRNDYAFALNARAYYRDIDYEFAAQDRQEGGGQLEISYNPFSLFGVTVYGNHLDVKYQSSTREDRDNEAGLRFRHRLSRHLSTTLEGRRIWRYSTDAFQEYIDNRVIFTLLYASSPLFVPIRR